MLIIIPIFYAGLEHENFTKTKEIQSYKAALEELEKKIESHFLEKKEFDEKLKDTIESSKEKFSSLNNEILTLKKMLNDQTKEIESLKQNPPNFIPKPKQTTHIMSLNASPISNQELKNLNYERLSSYQDKKNKFDKSPTTYNVMKYSNTSNLINFLFLMYFKRQ